MDPYAAFDFFVTAEHMPEWLYPPSEIESEEKIRRERRQEVKRQALPSVVSHLANNAKHFEADPKRHSVVVNVQARFGPIGHRIGPIGPRGLFVVLHSEVAGELGIGGRPSAVTLAERTVEFWEHLVRRKVANESPGTANSE